ncbi:RNA polymerase subunit sigma-24 [Asanoa ishikariensis]|uniref:RNA polymerase sigma factor, sigma-70 family n=1 Tax=Asanoa ishikariensis TaxID=137265 RepID=A0A1H3L8Q8_9ACTN|nr:sigma-70 family RNA polymerase sigma factor [Asanoa ishikariensis]GIF65304.1 RNA polymerase subunit sigma-24 [Asanoa ishikariensis]SDY60314.1 RNA polymerase sigma factor, sigma-70 family [Asanoa ishikariensis]
MAGVDAFDAVYAAQYAPLVRLAYVTVGSMPAAEDVVQDVFIEWYRRIDQVEAPAAYLRKAVVSRCSSWVRRRILERRHAGTFDQPPVVPPDAGTVAVRAAMAQLAPRYRMALFLRYYLDLSVAEVAETLDCPLGTAKSLLHRGLAHLQAHLEDR